MADEIPVVEETPLTEVVTENDPPEDTSTIPELGEEAIAEFLNDDDDDALDLDADTSEKESIETPPEGKEKETTVEEAKPAEEPVPEEKAKPEGEGEKPPVAEPKPTETPSPEIPSPAPEQVPGVTPPPSEPVTPTEEAPVLTPEEQTAAYNTWREGIETNLAEGQYALSDDEVIEMDITQEAGKAHSKSMARVYMDSVTGAIGHITKAMPQLLEVALAKRNNESAAEAEFYAAWPGLNRATHGEVIGRLGRTYRTAYPQAPKADFIRDVGAQAIVALRIPLNEAPTKEVVKEIPPASSAAFKPAGSGTPSGGPQPKENPFTQLSIEFDEEEMAGEL